LEASPVLRQEVEGVTASEVRLRGGVVIAIHANSFRSIRGRTLLAVVLDEVAFFRDETSALPDVETYRAVLPALATTDGLLVGISTPYRRLGLLAQKHRDHYGVPDDDVLVVQGESRLFNPTLPAATIEAALAADPEAARAEWEAEFRGDLQSFLDDATVDASVVHGRPLELPPRAGHRYRAFVDPSGGRHDAYAICVGHKEGDAFVADVVRGARPPFDPAEVTKEYTKLVKDYHLSQVTGDNFSAEWVVAAFRDHGVAYQRSERSKSQLYLECLPLFARGLMSLPDLPRLLRELRLLERQTHRSGKDTVDHGRRGSDDLANAVCGCAVHAVARGGYDTTLAWIDGVPLGAEATPEDAARAANSWRRLHYARYLATGGGARPPWMGGTR
jgi:hypothetical protein